MRADRLLSILMILQHRGRVTARALAAELEVSERTIHRDMNALSAAGVPVYGEPGPAGGFSLVEAYRTTLTGLSAGEARALFMLSLPAPLTELGVGPELKAALYKLAAALPEARRADERAVHLRFHLDAVGWQAAGAPVPHLQTLYQAVWADECLEISHQPIGGLVMEQVVEPYGLVAKAGVWYLVCRLPGAPPGRERVHRAGALLAARATGQHFVRDPAFDLPAFWRAWCAQVAAGQRRFVVQARVSPAILPYLEHYLGPAALAAAPAEPDASAPGAGWPVLVLAFESFMQARERLLALGAAVEVLAPAPLRLSVADVAEQILKRHRPA